MASGFIEESFSKMFSNIENKKYLIYALTILSVMVVFNYYGNYFIKDMGNGSAISFLTVINVLVVLLITFVPKFFLKNNTQYNSYIQTGLANSSLSTMLWGVVYVCNLVSYYNDPTRLRNTTSTVLGIYENKSILVSAINATGALIFDCIQLIFILRHTETTIPLFKMMSLVLGFLAVGLVFIWFVYFTEKEIVSVIHESKEFTDLINKNTITSNSFIDIVNALNQCNPDSTSQDAKLALYTLGNSKIFINISKIFNRPLSSMFMSRHNRIAIYSIIMFLDVFLNISGMTSDFIDIAEEFDYLKLTTVLKSIFVLCYGIIPIGLDIRALYEVIEDNTN